jgi:MFS family permease
MQFLCAPLLGRLSDRIGRRPVMLVTIAGTSGSLVLLGLADSLPLLFLARVLGGAFGANVSVASAYLSDVTAEEERTRWMGMLGASFGVGFLLGPAIGGLLAPYGYGVPMLVAAAMAAGNFFWALRALREPPSHAERAAEGSERLGRWEMLRSLRIRRLCGTNFLFAFAVTQLEAMFAYFMLHRFGYDMREVAFLLVMMAAIMMVIQGGGMRTLAARFGERRLLLWGAMLMSLAFAAIPWMPTVPILLLPLAVAAVGRAISQPSLMSMASLAATPETRGVVMGTFQSAAALARVFGPTTAGVLYDLNRGTPFWLAGALMVGVLIAGAAASATQHGDAALRVAADPPPAGEPTPRQSA